MRGPNLNLAIDGVRAHWGARSLTTRLTVVAALGALGVGYLSSLNPCAQPAHLAVLTRVVIVVTLVLTGIYAQTNRLQPRIGALLIGTGLYCVVWSLNGSAEDLAFTVGAVAGGVPSLVFSTILLSHPQGRFIQAAASVALMRLESAQLKADLRASTADLYASRVRLVEAAHGFDASATANGTGIANMRDRVEAIGGTLRVDSAPARALASGAARGRRSPPRARSADERGTRDPWP